MDLLLIFSLQPVSILLACLSIVNNFKVSPEFYLFCHWWFSFYVQHCTKEIHLSLLDMYAWLSLYLCTYSTIIPAFIYFIWSKYSRSNARGIHLVLKYNCVWCFPLCSYTCPLVGYLPSPSSWILDPVSLPLLFWMPFVTS